MRTHGARYPRHTVISGPSESVFANYLSLDVADFLTVWILLVFGSGRVCSTVCPWHQNRGGGCASREIRLRSHVSGHTLRHTTMFPHQRHTAPQIHYSATVLITTHTMCPYYTNNNLTSYVEEGERSI